MRSGSELREHNIGLVFDAFDIDHDGFLTETDLPAVGQRIIDAFGITDPQQRAQLVGAYQAAWPQLSADCDSDGDGRITRQEFITALSSGRGDPHAYYQQLLAPGTDAAVRAADQDGDGFITAEEYARLFASQNVDAEIIHAAFARLDTDGDGKLTTDELRDVAVQLILGEDPANPGTSALGGWSGTGV